MTDRVEQILEFQANVAAQTYDLFTRVEKQMAATHSVLVHQEVRNILSETRYNLGLALRDEIRLMLLCI